MTAAHLVFRLDGALYAVRADTVRELFQLPELTPVVEAPRWIAGVLNFRGQVIPVLDLGVRLGNGVREYRLSDAVIALELRGTLLGIVVDEVLDVRLVPDDQTEYSPVNALAATHASRLAGRIARMGNELITLLDVNELLQQSESFPLSIPGDEETYSGSPAFTRHSPLELAIYRERADALIQSAGNAEEVQVAPVAVFTLNGEWFGVDLEWVREFADLREVTPVPCCPRHVVGTVNLRGEILTLVDIRQALSMASPPLVNGAKMIVVQVGEMRAGVVVDQVLDVIHLGASDLAPVPYSVRSTFEEHVAGMANYRDKLLAILDLSGIFNREDWIVDEEP